MFGLWLACLGLVGAFPGEAFAAEHVRAIPSLEKGFARIVLSFTKLPKYEVKVANGVMVIKFPGEITLNIRGIPSKLPEYIIVGRLDPDGRGVRFAMAQPVKVNTIEAGDQLFIDIMPKSWTGLPPALPKEVVAELARRAKKTAKITRHQKMLASLKLNKFKMKARVAEYPTFSRVQFDWNTRVEAALKRKGDEITVLFGELAHADIGRLKSDPPNFVKSAKMDVTREGLKISLKINPQSDVRGFRDGSAYVIDITAPPGSVPVDATTAKVTGQPVQVKTNKTDKVSFRGNRPKGSPPASTVNLQTKPARGDEALKSPLKPPAVRADRKKTAPEPARVIKKLTRLDHNGAKNGIPSVATPAAASKLPPAARAQINKAIKRAHPAAGVVKPAASVAKVKAVVKPTAPAAKPKMVMSNRTRAAPKQAPGTKKQTVARKQSVTAAAQKPANLKPLNALIVEQDTSVELKFPFEKQVPAAVFVRAQTLWVVFDTPRQIDLAWVRVRHPLHFSSISKDAGEARQILKFKLSQPYLVAARLEGNHWIVAIGDLVVDRNKTISLKRKLRSDGRAKVLIDLKKPGPIFWVVDPEVGDQLGIVTASGPVRFMSKVQNFVDFTSLATAHGLAIKPHTDNLDIRAVDGEVLVTRTEGLTVSSQGLHLRRRGQRVMADMTRPGFIDYKSWRGKDLDEYVKRLHQLQTTITNLPTKQSVGPRFELARTLMARMLNAEAIGTMKRIVEIDRQIEKDPVFNAMRGVANLMMYRLAQARKDLNVRGLNDDLDIALWRGLLHARDGRWRDAQKSFLRGASALRKYPDDIRTMFKLATARAALGVNDIGAARFNLDSLPESSKTPAVMAEANVLQGRLLQALGKHEDALKAYGAAIASDIRRFESEARYYQITLAFRLGKLTLKEAIGRLHRVALSWRGDELELNVLYKLAQLQTDQKNFRASLRTMKTAISNYPHLKLTNKLKDNMARLFTDLFLRGKVDSMPPVQALSLYYDYRELTPVGRLGDKMIRQLADRLISVDLLTQAAELLTHQVENRLIGAAKAQVAAKLALVHMLNLKPHLALKVLRQTRVAVLPKKLLRKRRLLEARALSGLGRAQPAVDLLAGEPGEDAAKLRAEAYWRGKKWREAAEAYEKLLGTQWKGDKPLNARQRMIVLRTAVAYSFANDELGMARFRNKFRPKMSQSQDSNSFAVITQPTHLKGIEFRNVARDIAAINTLEGFLSEVRKRFAPKATPTPAG